MASGQTDAPKAAVHADELARALAALRESEERLRTAIEAANLGIFEWLDPPRGPRRWSRRSKELFGFRGDEADVTPEQFVAAIHPDDRARWAQHIRDIIECSPESPRVYHVEYRVIDARTETERWICASGRLFSDAAHGSRLLGTMEDITERKHAEQDRELFLGMLAHDLRNPLGVISTAAALLERRGDGAVTRIAERIAASAKRMGRLVEDLLEFARLRAGGLVIRRVAADLRAICSDVVDELVSLHPGRSIALVSDREVAGEWDRDRIQQVVSNLVTNALVHGRADAPVRVEVRADGEAAVVDVINHGDAIPDAVRVRLFDPYRRATTGGAGVGLGLYIAKAIVAAHGGRIDVSSNVDETRFTVTLTRRAAHADVAGR